MKLFKPMPKDQRLARRRFLQLIREYDELREKLEAMQIMLSAIGFVSRTPLHAFEIVCADV